MNSLVLTLIFTESATRSPLFTTYSETIAGVSVLRSFGASTKSIREMQQQVNTVGFYLWGQYTCLTYLFDAELNSVLLVVVGE